MENIFSNLIIPRINLNSEESLVSAVSLIRDYGFDSFILFATDKVTFGDGSVKLIANANESITFNDPSGALLTLAAGYDTDAPVFSVTDKAGMPLMDIFEDDRINMGPYLFHLLKRVLLD